VGILAFPRMPNPIARINACTSQNLGKYIALTACVGFKVGRKVPNTPD
jgi:hypothetical protein